MRNRTWLALLALGGVLASLGCELPTEIGGSAWSTDKDCFDLLFPCQDDNDANVFPPGPEMRLRVTTVTTGTPLDSNVRYRLEITSSNGGAGWYIAPNYTWVYVWDHSHGGRDHRVALLEVPTHCEVQGQNPRTVRIVRTTIEEFKASPVETTFEIICV